MWNLTFLKDSTWRAFRTFCQSLSGLLVMNHVSSAFNAPWLDLIGASLLAALTSLLMSVDRERAVTGAPAAPTDQPEAELVAFAAKPFGGGCGTDLR